MSLTAFIHRSTLVMGFPFLIFTPKILSAPVALLGLWLAQPKVGRPFLNRHFCRSAPLILTVTPVVDRHINELRDCFPWGSLKGTVVDVGGGSGHISIALARVSILACLHTKLEV